MLNFEKLSSDGIKFEQLVREVLLAFGLKPYWTGVGPDSGRDLLAEENLKGPISERTRIWLVDCKHFAKSRKSVGVRDVLDIRDRCERVGADGFLLATSTQPSSELVNKLRELRAISEIETMIWDSVDLEKRLCNTKNYYIAQQFFPESAQLNDWKLYYTENGHLWIAHYKSHFLYLESRSGVDPLSLEDAETIVMWLQGVALGEGECLRVRKIWHDTPNGPCYVCHADYLVPANREPTLSPSDLAMYLPAGDELGGSVDWYVTLQLTLPHSDYYSPDDLRFYEDVVGRIFNSRCGLESINRATKFTRWRPTPPPLRNVGDQLMWMEHRERHGFGDPFELMRRRLRENED